MKTLFLISCLLLLVSNSYADVRKFTNKSGKTLDAELVCATQSFATLRLAGNKEVEVAVTTLSDADNEFIKEWIDLNTLGGAKDLDRFPRPFREPFTGKVISATLDRILETEDLEQFAVMGYPDGTSRAFRLKTLSGTDKEYVMQQMVKASGAAIDGLSKDPKNKALATDMKKILEEIAKAAKKGKN